MQLVYKLIFLNNFLLGYTKNAYNQRGFKKRYLHNNQLAKANIDNEAIHNAFLSGCVAIGYPERHMRKASHRGSKQQ